MKKVIIIMLLAGIALFTACGLEDPAQPELNNILPAQLVLTKMVAIGNSLTAGVQSAGLAEDFQKNSYPYLIAQQMGRADQFEQPLIADPGLSNTPGVGVLDFVNGEIVPRGTYTNPLALAKNINLPRPYDNLGLPGADLNDMLTFKLAPTPGIWDLILRNPNFGNTTVLEQARLLNPTLIFFWGGSNDVLGAATNGGDPGLITPVADFQSDYLAILAELSLLREGNFGLILANIPNVTDMPYVNMMDNLIFRSIPALGITDPVPVVFDSNFQPVLFDSATGLYLPLLTIESNVEHVLLPFLSEYQASGLGVPDSAALVAMGLPPGNARNLVRGMIAAGLKVSGQSIPATLTMMTSEEQIIQEAVAGYNQVITGIASSTSPNIPVVDINSLMAAINSTGVDGVSGKFVFFDPAATAYSLDGVHPSNAGYALVANEFLKVMNAVLGQQIPLLNVDNYKGQYTGTMATQKISLEAAKQVREYFVKR